MKKIGIWGQFGDGGLIADGQAVRTTIITDEIVNKYGVNNVSILNTNGWKRNPFSFFYRTIKLLKNNDVVIIFPADNGFKVVVRLYDFFNRFFKKELIDVVIGGYLPGLLKKKKRYKKKLMKYKGLFVQTPSLKTELENLGINNVYILSNLKKLNTVNCALKHTEKHLKVCTLSRIDYSKGITFAVEGVKKANIALGEKVYSLTIFGIIMPEYKDSFDALLNVNSDFVHYGGVLEFNKTVESLKDYFALIFPTFYYGEGFAGNLIDAFNSGLPVIATDWNYNREVIKDNVNGLLVPIKDSDSICAALIRLYSDRELAFNISENNIKESTKYSPNKVLSTFFEIIEK